MRLSMFVLLALSSPVIFAQNPMGMNPADMEKLMQQAHKAQACMEKVDQSQMVVLEQRGKQFEAEMDSLCASGKRDDAQKKAIAFAKEVSDNTEVQAMFKAMKKCGEMMKGMMPEMSFMEQDFNISDAGVHVCSNR